MYLNAAGWRTIRQRKCDLQCTLRDAIEVVRASGEAVHILDLAAGPGRYALEVLREFRKQDGITAVMRDRSETALAAGRALAQQMGMSNVSYEHGDAFDHDSIAAALPRPTIVIVSGLYELFTDNKPILESLSGVAAVIRPGGLLIYTNQPWHPQIELIARVLRNRDGKPWIMRCRTTAEIDELVASTGFVKTAMRIGPQGICSVSIARRR